MRACGLAGFAVGTLHQSTRDIQGASEHLEDVIGGMVGHAPANATPLRQQAFIPAITVGPHGVLVMTYYDFRNDTSNGQESTDYWALFCKSRAADCTNPANWGGEITRRAWGLRAGPRLCSVRKSSSLAIRRDRRCRE